MPFPEIVLREAPPPGAYLPSRADVAVFVGLVGRRAGPLPDAVRGGLEAAGWAGAGPHARSDGAVAALLDVPVPVSSWAAFDALYAWDGRRLGEDSPRTLACPLGLAVRSFFAEGGLKAWIVRTGDPLPLIVGGARAARRALLSAAGDPPAGRVQLLPGLGGRGARVVAADPRTWHGVGHVLGVEEAALLALPDLAELCAPGSAVLPALPGPPPITEAFKPCGEALPGAIPPAPDARPPFSAPRLDQEGYALWADAISDVLELLAAPRGPAHRRDVMLVASLPLPRGEGDLAGLEGAPLDLLSAKGLAGGARLFDEGRAGSARLQLAYPWVATAASATQPEGIEPPEGVLMGVLARTALAGGAFRSAASAPLPSVAATVPELRTGAIRAALGAEADWAGDRLCLIGPRPGGFALLSDATTSPRRAWRAGGVSRLMGVILRAARWIGADRLFEPAGPALWAEITTDLESFLEELWQLGALAGAEPHDAFRVRCDATVMSQADIDAGRTVVEISIVAAQPVQRITVTLALGDGGGARLAEAA